ncbi:Ig-like domain-containing protein [Pseudomonas aeruginosa]|uniref:Ig-like domain-containing protein n=1 Tax=Pseudomonas aeruginosa TaxID=287 RepID=UPI003F411FB9
MSSAALKDHINVNVATGVQTISLPAQPANIILSSSKEDVANYSRVGNDLRIEFRDGTTLDIQGFFLHGSKYNNLLFSEGDQQWLADFSQSLATATDGVDDSLVHYELLSDDNYFLPILGALGVVAGGVTLASDGDGGGGGSHEAPAPAAPAFVVMDDLAPGIGNLQSGASTNDSTPTLHGSGASPNARVTIQIGGQEPVTVVADGNGNWSYEVPELEDGSHHITVTQTDSSNKTSAPSEFDLNVDTSRPTVSIDAFETDDGQPHPTGSATADSTPVLVGTATPHSRVTVLENGSVLGTAVVDDTGHWRFSLDSQADGAHRYTATVSNPLGVVAESALELVIDASAPQQQVFISAINDDRAPLQGVIANAGVSNDNSPQLNGTLSAELDAGEVLLVLRNGVVLGNAVVSGRDWFYQDAGLADGGPYVYTARVEDAVGNRGAASAEYSITIDTAAPAQSVEISAINDDQAPVIGMVANNGFSNDQTPQLSGTLSAALDAGETLVVLRDGVVIGTGSVTGTDWTFQDVGLVNGTTYRYTARVEDAAGNRGSDSASYTLSIDTSAPTQSVVIGAITDDQDPVQGVVANNGFSNDQTPQLSGTLSAALDAGETLVVLRDGVVIGTGSVTGTSWTFQDSGLVNGTTYRYTARIEDAAGNRGGDSASYTLSIDTSAPTQSVVISAITDDQDPVQGVVANNGSTNDSTPHLSGTLSATLNPGERVVILRDGAALGTATVSGTNWSYDDAGLNDGQSYVYTARVEDAAGNRGAISATYGITLDATAPAQTVSIDRVLDDVDPVQGVVSNGGTTNDSQPQLEGSVSAQLADNEVVAVYRDGARLGEASVTGTAWSFTDTTGLSNGSTYSYTVRVEDAAGNQGAESTAYGLTLQTDGPATQVVISAINDNLEPVQGVVANNGFSNDQTPQLSGTLSAALDAGETLVVLRDGVVIGTGSVTGTDWTFDDSGLADGTAYTYTARVEDAAGNPGSASNSYRVQIDTSVPSQSVTLDRALDNVDPVSGEIAAGGTTNDDTPTLEGSLSAALTGTEQLHVFRDGVDLGLATVTGTQWTFTDGGLASGSTYEYTARVIDAAGNAGAASNSLGFSVNTDGVSQTVQILQIVDDVDPKQGVVANNGDSNDLAPQIKGSLSTALAAGDVVEVLRDGMVLGTATVSGTSWTYDDSGLVDGGTYVYTARVVNSGGNQGALSSPYTLHSDTSAPTQTVIIAAINDDQAPIVGVVANNGFSNDQTPQLSGTLSAELDTDETLVILRDGVVIGTGSVTGTSWTFQDAGLVNGTTYRYTARVEDAAGNRGSDSASYGVSIDTSAPTQSVVIGAITDDQDPVQGVVANNGSTNDSTPHLSGTLSATLNPGESIVILRDGAVLGTATVSGTNWSYDDAGLSDGQSYVYTARVEDAAGNRGAISANYGISLDATAPAQTVSIDRVLDDVDPVQGEIANGGSTNDSQPELQGALSAQLAANEVVAVYRDGVRIGEASVAGTAWSFTDTTGLSNGSTYSYTARVEDAAGNQGPLSADHAISLDTSVPSQTVVIAAITDDQDPVQGVVANNGVSNDLTPQLSGTLSATLNPGESLVILRDGVVLGTATVNGTDWTYDDAGLSDGQSYIYTARVEDAAGNRGSDSASYGLGIDSSAPTQSVVIVAINDDQEPIQGVVANNGYSNDQTPQLSGTLSAALDAGETLVVLRDGVVIGTGSVTGTSWTFQDSGLVNGTTYRYTARIEDAAGNRGGDSASYTLSIDTSAPTQSVVISAITDDQDPVQGVVANNGSTNDSTPHLSGTLSATLNPGERVVILRDGAALGTATVSGTNWSYDDAGLNDGQSYVYTARVEDAAGNRGAISATYGITLDATAPAQTVSIDRVLDDVDPVQGVVSNGGTTNDSQPQLEGSVSAQLADNEVVAVYRDGARLGEASVTGTAWSFTDTTGLSNGSTYSYTVRVEDAAGNQGAESTAYGLTLQTDGPATQVVISAINDNLEPVQGVVANNGFSNDQTPQLSGTLSAALDAGETLVVLRDGVVIGTGSVTGTDWTFDDSGLADGTAYTYTARVEDAAGNPGSASNSYRVQIDTSVPSQSVTLDRALDNVDPVSGEIAAGGTTNDDTPTLEGSLSAALTGTEQLHVFRDGVDLGLATVTGTQWTFTDGGLASGSTYEYTARVIDAAGNAGAASNSLGFSVNTDGVSQTVQILQIVDDVDPKQGVVANNGDSNDLAPQIKGSLSTALAAGDVVEVLRDGMVLGTATVSGTSWTYDDSGLVDGGTYVYTARVVNSGGNQGALSSPYTLHSDTSAPTQTVIIAAINDDQAPIVGVVANNGFSNDQTPQLSGTLSAALNAGETLVVLRDGVVLGTASVTGTNWTFQDSGLANGTTYSYTARVEDAAGNRGSDSASYGVSIDTSAPTQSVVIDAIIDDLDPVQGVVSNNGYSNDQTPQLSGTLSAALNGGESVLILRDGVVLGPATVTGTSWTFSDAGLADGTAYTYTARVQDAAGNLGSTSNSYRVQIDASAPAQTVTLDRALDNVDPVSGQIAAGGITNDDTPTLEGSLSAPLSGTEQLHVFRDGVDLGAASVTGTQWAFTDGGLASGSTYEYTARVIDAAGNAGTASNPLSFGINTDGVSQTVQILQIVDDVDPKQGLVSNGGASNDLAPQLKGSLSTALAVGDVLEVLRDGAVLGNATVAGTSWTYDDAGLVDGQQYVYTARVVNSGGNQGALSSPYTLSIDTSVPTQIVAITAINDDQAPVVGVVPNNGFSNDTTPQLSGTLSAALGVGESVVILRDGVVLGAASVTGTTWTFQDAGLLNGTTYSYSARVEDAAGNRGSDSTSYGLTLDTSAPSQSVSITAIDDDQAPVVGVVPNNGFSNDTTPQLSGTLSASLGAGEQVVILRDGVAVGTANVTGTNWTFQDVGLVDGTTYSYSARVEDVAGNRGNDSASYAMTLDTTAPTATVGILGISDDTGSSTSDFITADPSLLVTAQLTGMLGSGEKVQISLDNGATWHDAVSAGGQLYSYDARATALADATYQFQARVVDAAGNTGPEGSQAVLIDTLAPTAQAVIGYYVDDAGSFTDAHRGAGTYTDDITPTLFGTLQGALGINEKIAIYVGDTLRGYATSLTGGQWSFADSGLVQGNAYAYRAVVVDTAGNAGMSSSTFSLTIDSSDTNLAPALGQAPTNAFSMAVGVGQNGLWSVISDQAAYSAAGIKSYTQQLFDISSSTVISNGKSVANQTGSDYGGITFGSWSLADYDRNGYVDIYTTDARYQDASSTVFIGGPSGFTASVVDYLNVQNETDSPDSHLGSVISLDMNGDGYLDVMVGDSQGDSAIFLLNKGALATGPGVLAGQWYGYGYDTATSFTAPSIVDVTIDHELSAVDIDNNGTLDFVGHTIYTSSSISANALSVLKNSGVTSTNGSNWTVAQSIANVFNANGNAGNDDYRQTVSLTWADFNGDGFLDLYINAVRTAGNATSPSSAVFYNNAGVLSNAPQRFNDTVQGQASVAVDWDGDGDMDVIELPNSTSSAGLAKLYLNGGVTAGQVSWTPSDLASAGEVSNGSSRLALSSIANGISGAAAIDYDWDGDVDLLVSLMGAASSIVVNNPNTPAEGSSLHLRILDQNGMNVLYGNTVQLYNAAGVLVASQILNAQSGMGVNDSSAIVNFYGLDAHQVYNAVLLRNVNGASSDIGGAASLGSVTVENVNDSWGQLTPAAANHAYVLSAESGQNVANGSFVGTGYNDTFVVGLGADSFDGSGGTATLNGVSTWSATGGVDVLDYRQAGSAALTVDLGLTTAQVSGYGTSQTLKNIEGVAGAGGNDQFTDSAADNLFEGRGGDDLYRLSNGGHDTLLFKLLDAADGTGGNGHDQVQGFTVGDLASNANADRIDLKDLLLDYHVDGDGPAHYRAGIPTLDTGDRIGEYLSVTLSGSDTTLNVDRDGVGAAFSAVPLLTLQNVNTDLLTLLANHQVTV